MVYYVNGPARYVKNIVSDNIIIRIRFMVSPIETVLSLLQCWRPTVPDIIQCLRTIYGRCHESFGALNKVVVKPVLIR